MNEMHDHGDEIMEEMERRYYLTFLLTEEMEDESLYDELDSIASRMEKEEAGAEEAFQAYETKILTHYKQKFPAPEIEAVPEAASLLQSRLYLLYFVAELDEDADWKKELLDLAKEIKDASPSRLEEIDEDLALMEEDVILYYFGEDEDEEEEEETEDEEEEE